VTTCVNWQVFSPSLTKKVCIQLTRIKCFNLKFCRALALMYVPNHPHPSWASLWLGADQDNWAQSVKSYCPRDFQPMYFYTFFFENQVSWKAFFCIVTTIILHPDTLVCFFSTRLPLPQLDSGVHQEGLAKVMDKKLINPSCLED